MKERIKKKPTNSEKTDLDGEEILDWTVNGEWTMSRGERRFGETRVTLQWGRTKRRDHISAGLGSDISRPKGTSEPHTLPSNEGRFHLLSLSYNIGTRF